MLGLAVIAVVLSVWIAVLVLGAVVLAGGRARTAADLAAVGGAQKLLSSGQQDLVCHRAARVAKNNGSDLVSCVVWVADATELGGSVEVVVQMETGLSIWPAVEARARAGLVADEA